MIEERDTPDDGRPRFAEHAISALNACFGDYLAETGNELHLPLAFYRDNRPVPPEDLPPPPTGKVCVFIHGLGSNESLWSFPAPHEGGGYGELLEQRCGYTPLYLRYNSGRRISENGRALAHLLERLRLAHDNAIGEIMLVGHSMGGLLIRSACHVATEDGQVWVERVRRAVYLGTPHLGAPLEKFTNVATHLLGFFDTTATRVIRDLLNTRAVGVKDLRFGNVVDADWLDCDPDELLRNRRVPVPWLATARHYRVVGHALPGVHTLGDAVVRPQSAAAVGHGPPEPASGPPDVQVMEGFNHLALARHPAVYEHIERWMRSDD